MTRSPYQSEYFLAAIMLMMSIAGSPAIAQTTQDTPSSETDTADSRASADKKTRDKNTLTLAPQGEWKLREYSDKCRASRVFGDGENRTTLWIDQGGTEPNYNVTLIGQPLRNPYGNAVRIQFGEEPESIRSYIRATSSKGRPVLTMYGVALTPPDIDRKTDAKLEELTAQRLDTIANLRMSDSIINPINLELGSVTAPITYLRSCAEQLALDLFLAQSAKARNAQPAKLLNEGMISKKIRFPKYLQRARMDGKVEFRLTVNSGGKPTNCSISASNRPQLFDDAVCLGLMKNAKFTPALDGDGKAVASYFSSLVTFRLR